jgi:hypothetical protein
VLAPMVPIVYFTLFPDQLSALVSQAAWLVY